MEYLELFHKLSVKVRRDIVTPRYTPKIISI